jgi:hypothetical protein
MTKMTIKNNKSMYMIALWISRKNGAFLCQSVIGGASSSRSEGAGSKERAEQVPWLACKPYRNV